MLELIIECWTALDGKVDYRWSVWRDGRRTQMGGANATAELCETAGLAYCREELDRAPDRITRL